MGAISFEVIGDELILCYTPAMGIDGLLERLSSGNELSIKHTFFVSQKFLRNSDQEEFDFEETLRFCIGKVGDTYTQLDSEVIGTDHSFYFENEIKLKSEMFVAYRNISILRKIDELIERDFYIGGDWETNNGISKETFMELIKKFPKSAELDKYAHYRIANILKEQFPECDKYEEIYNKYIAAQRNSYLQKDNIVENADPTKNAIIPFWMWQDKQTEVYTLLSKYNTNEDKNHCIFFNLPLLDDSLSTCDCFVTARGIEIIPEGITIAKIRSFTSAQRRIFMSATLSDDSVFVSAIGLQKEDIRSVISPDNANDIGDRLILFPRYLNSDITNADIRNKVFSISQNHNVVVIVTSFARAKYWDPKGFRTIAKDNIENTVSELKTKHI